MKLPLLSDVARLDGPFASVCLDATRSDESGEQEVRLRWRAQQSRFRELGTPDPVIDAMESAAGRRPEQGGPAGNPVIAAGGELVLAMTLPAAPARDEASYGPAPHLLPAIRAAGSGVRHVIVAVDRTGAAIDIVDRWGATRHSEVAGEHDEVHPVPAGMSERRIQARVHDSWDRNAEAVAVELDRVVSRVRPEVVIVTGDPYAVSALTGAVSPATADLVVRVPGGGRAQGVSEQAWADEVTEVLRSRRAAARTQLVDRFTVAESLQQEAVQGFSAVVDAVRRGQVDELLIDDDPTSTRTLWSGPGPAQIGIEAGEPVSLGADDPVRMRADAVLIRGVLATDGGVTMLEDQDPRPTDGIAALLRWSDPSTPHDAAPSMPGHGEG